MEKKHLNAHDLFFKGAMQHKEMAQEFFIANIPKNILEKIDLNKIKASNTTFIEEAFKEKRSDVLFDYTIKRKNALYPSYLKSQHCWLHSLAPIT